MTFNKSNGKFLEPPAALKTESINNEYGQLENVNQTRINIKAQKVLNNSIQTLMKNRDNSNDANQTSSPIPNYPNFEAQKLGHTYYGQIGWGLERKNIKYNEPYEREQNGRAHINVWDKKKE